MRSTLATAAAVLLLAPAASAASAAPPAGFREAVKLEPAASFVAGKPVQVACAKGGLEWVQFIRPLYGNVNPGGATAPGSTLIHLSPTVCRYLEAQLRKPTKKPGEAFAGSLLTIVHEAIHARGERDEGTTDCAAVHESPRVAVRYFHVRSGRQLRGMMALMWQYRAESPPDLRTVC
jgi:hypothetical protein